MFDMSSLGNSITLMVALPFVLVALFLLFLAMRSRGKARAARDWSETMGTVLMSGAEARRSHDSDGGYSTSHYPVVVYEYVVNGRRYQSNRFNFGSEVGYGFQGMAQNRAAKFPQGATIPVFYNPEDPSQSVLEKTGGASSKILIFAVIMVVIILATTLFFTTSMTNGLSRMF